LAARSDGLTNSPTDRNIANYDTPWSAEEYTREGGLRPIEAALVAAYFPAPPARVLDLGCGAGRTTMGLADLGYEVVAIDLSDRLLALARQRRPDLDFRKMDATRLELPDVDFDAALFSYNGIDCIGPVGERLRCMREVHRVLRPAAPFVLSSHNIVGTIFSGGFFYLRGYWNAAKLLASQLTNPAALKWYFLYQDGGGPQRLYSAPPGRTVRQLQDVGFRVEDVCGVTGERSPQRVLFHQMHVHFAARKAP